MHRVPERRERLASVKWPWKSSSAASPGLLGVVPRTGGCGNGRLVRVTLAPARITDRQRQVLYVYALTGSYKETAPELGIALPTVRCNLVEVRRRLGVTTSVQAVLIIFGRVA